MTEDGEHATQILLQVVPHMGQNAHQGEIPVQMAVETPGGEQKVGIMVIQQDEVRDVRVGLSWGLLVYFWPLVDSGFAICLDVYMLLCVN